MAITDVLSLLSGPAITTIAFIIFFMTGMVYTKGAMEDKEKQLAAKDEEIRELKQALVMERQRSDAGVLAGTVVRDIMTEMRREIR